MSQMRGTITISTRNVIDMFVYSGTGICALCAQIYNYLASFPIHDADTLVTVKVPMDFTKYFHLEFFTERPMQINYKEVTHYLEVVHADGKYYSERDFT